MVQSLYVLSMKPAESYETRLYLYKLISDRDWGFKLTISLLSVLHSMLLWSFSPCRSKALASGATWRLRRIQGCLEMAWWSCQCQLLKVLLVCSPSSHIQNLLTFKFLSCLSRLTGTKHIMKIYWKYPEYHSIHIPYTELRLIAFVPPPIVSTPCNCCFYIKGDVV